MPEHLRALVVILALSAGVFLFAKAPATALAMAPKDFERRRNLWFAITLTAFLAHNFWVYIIVTATLLLLAIRREPNKLAMFFFLLFAVPPIPEEITGLGLIRYFFGVDYIRLLILAVLFPAFLSLQKQPEIERFGRSIPDKLIAGYIILNFLLMLSASTFTNSLRHGGFYAFIGIFLPYYVASRSLTNLSAFRDALMAFVVAALLLSAIATFEFGKHWMLYSALENALGVRWDVGSYLARGESLLRAQGPAGHPIALGYVIAVGLGFFLYIRKTFSNSVLRDLSLLLLIVGLIAPVSRGPWIGAAAILLVFLLTAKVSGQRFATLALLGAIICSALLLSPAGEKIIDLLPFIGTVDEYNVTYRQRLLEISIQVILQNPFFGAFDYIYSPAMQELKQGQGIIDIVNSYVGVALASGLVGLGLFLGFFIAVAIGIFRGMRTLTDKNSELYLLGQALLSTLVGILVIICAASSVLAIPAIYWAVAGLGVAYARLLAFAKVPKAVQRENFQPSITSIRA